MNWSLFSATLAVVSALCCGVVGAAPDVYRWIDADGELHYGDRPRDGGEMIDVKTPDVGDPTAATGEADEADAEEAREANCDKASQRLADYEKADQLIGEDEYGRKHDITGEERVELILRAQKDVEELCGEAVANEPGEPAPAKSAPSVEEASTPPEEAPNDAAAEKKAAAIIEDAASY